MSYSMFFFIVIKRRNFRPRKIFYISINGIKTPRINIILNANDIFYISL